MDRNDPVWQALKLSVVCHKSTQQAEKIRNRDNPYLKFIKRVRNEALHKDDKKSLGKSTSDQTNAIVQEFLDWYNNLGGEHVDIDKATIKELFQIGFDTPMATCTEESINQLPVIPKKLAHVFAEPERPPPKLFIPRSKKHKRHVSVCSRLSLRHRITHLSEYQRERDHTELESMSRVWHGIENLWSTVGFAHWLSKHPEAPSPLYFIHSGLHKVDFNSLMERQDYFSDVRTTVGTIRGSLLIPVVKRAYSDESKSSERSYVFY